MNLSRFRSERRDCRICRFGVMLVVCSLLINMVAVPKAKAVVIDATAAFGAAAATAAINGTTATTLFTGMSTSAATTAMTTLMGEYATATGAAASGTALASTIGAGTIVTAAGAIVLTAAAGYAVYKFIEWLREEKGIEAGADTVLVPSKDYILLNDGTVFYLSTEDKIGSYLTFTDGRTEDLNGFYFAFSASYSYGTFYYYLKQYDSSTDEVTLTSRQSIYTSDRPTVCKYLGFSNYMPDYAYVYFYDDSFNYTGVGIFSCTLQELLNISSSVQSTCDFSLQPKSVLQTIPQEIPDGQAMVISGIENLPQADPQSAADLIMQTAIDGNLSPTVTVEADPTATPEPEPEPSPEPEPEPSPDPDAPELPSNLGDLGAALTTRFPFSIPWDIARAIKLIAAPAQAPYWEVDFLAPIAYRLPEGWKGSTKIVLDFGQPEYEIIGIASRWTSTIGFCLALAAATKRFIWTA